MSGKLHAYSDFQPAGFAFTPENLQEAEAHIAKYPAGRQQSALMPLLAIAQQQHNNWLPKAAMDVIADMLDMAPVRVYEVASFYTMYNLAPVGEHCVQLCTTTPCWLRGSDAIVDACEKHLGIKCGGTTGDGKFTLREVECLGACVNAPMLQLDSFGHASEFYEDLTPQNVVRIIDTLARGHRPSPGPQGGRVSSEPEGSAPAHKGAPADPMDATFGVSEKTKKDTAAAEAPGIHPEGAKRYSAEPKNKRKEAGDE